MSTFGSFLVITITISLTSVAITAPSGNLPLALSLFNNRIYQGHNTNSDVRRLSQLLFGGATTLDCDCPKLVDPACGYDGERFATYANPCILQCSQKNGNNLRLDYMGPCCVLSGCVGDVRPICDAEGAMHQNLCHFEYEQCVRMRRAGIYLGMDQSLENCPCSRQCPLTESSPVCDMLGRTHRNRCLFENAKCFAKIKHGIDLEVEYNGTCCDSLCRLETAKLFPLCDNNGDSYRDHCSFFVTKCILERKFQRNITIAKFGMCH